MQRFPGKIRFPDADTDDVTAVLTVSDHSLEIIADETSIGSWPVSGLELELGAAGYHVTLDGENLVLAPHDRFGFSHAVEEARESASNRQSRRARRKAAKRAKVVTRRPAESVTETGPLPIATLEPAAATDAPVSVPPPTPYEPQPDTATQPAETTTDLREKKPKKARRADKAVDTPKPAKPRRRRRRDVDAPKPVPHVPGLEDPDRDALWATHRNHEPTSFRERLNTSQGVRTLVLVAVPVVAVLLYVAPALIAVALLIPGAAAIVMAGLAMLDPSFTRYIPASLSDLRLMIAGVGCFLASLLVAWLF